MAGVAIKSKRKRPEKFTLSRASPGPLDTVALGKLISIGVDEISPNPFQPRQDFDAAELAELAHSIKTHGMRQPLDVRLVDDDYQLVAGERRLRAAKLAGLAEVPAVLRVTSDAEAREIAVVENLDRKDLSDIELARAFQGLIEFNGYTAETLAARLKGPNGATRSRSYVANLVRLLELPEEWQQRVVSHEMPSTLARYLLPYKDAPAILKAVDKHVQEHGLPSLKEWERDLNRVVRDVGHPLRRGVSLHSSDSKDGNYHSGDVRIDPKDPRYAELQVVEISSGNGSKERIALNAPLAKQMLAEKASAWRKAKAREAKGKKAGPNKAGPTKAQRERLQRELRDLVERWRLACCADVIAQRPELHERIVLWMHVVRFDAIDDALQHLAHRWSIATAKDVYLSNPQQDQLGRRLLESPDLVEIRAEFLGHVLRQASTVGDFFGRPPGESVQALAELLGVDLAEAWSTVGDEGVQWMLGPLNQEYLDAHSEDQLRDLCDEWSIGYAAGDTEEVLIERIRRPWRAKPLPLPAELADLVGTMTCESPP
jgi:ParB family chromosome partitioning protein